MKISRLILHLLTSFLLCHCASISLNIPGATIESPEVAGKGKKELGPSLEPSREIEYTDAANARPPDLDSAEPLGGTHLLLHQARFGLSDRFELGGGLGLDFNESGMTNHYVLTGKYQIFGPTKGEAKEGDASAGIHGRVTYLSSDGSGDQSSTFGPGGFPWSAKASAMTVMAGMSFGYRLADSLLVYFGGSYQNVKTTIDVTQEAASDLSDPGGTYKRDRNGRSLAYGAGLQLRLGKVFHLHGKLQQFEFYMDGIPNKQELYGSGGFHFFW